VILLHDGKRQIDPRGEARAGDQVAVLDEEAVFEHVDARILGAQAADQLPMCGAAAPVEKPGSGELEGSTADGSDPRAGTTGFAQP